MGKNKKKKNAPVKEKKSKQSVDERVKAVNAMQPPEENPFKMENEKTIESFLRFNRNKTDFRSIREKLKEKH